MTPPDRYETAGSPLGTPPFSEHPTALGATAFTGFEAATTNLVDALTGARSLLSAEQSTYADAAIISMSESLGLNREDIRLVLEETLEGNRRVVAIDASPNGQYVGLYRDILTQRQTDPAWYTVEVNGQGVDPLAGCTRAVYSAMIADARARGERFLPDSLALNQHNGHVWTATMMTGEPLESEGKIWIGSSSSYNKVNFVGQTIDRGGKSFRVRPAVVVGQVEV